MNPYPSNFQVMLLPTGLGLGKTDRLRGKRGKVEEKKGKSREKMGIVEKKRKDGKKGKLEASMIMPPWSIEPLNSDV